MQPAARRVGFAEIDFQPRLFFFDGDVWTTALKLKAQLERPCRSQSVYVDALGIALAHELIRVNDGRSTADTELSGGLPPWQHKSSFLRSKVLQHHHSC